MFKIQIITILMLLSISILKIRTETNTVLKSQIKKYLYYSRILDDLIASKSDLNSSIKKTLVFTKMKQLEKIFMFYMSYNCFPQLNQNEKCYNRELFDQND
jgi:hypothetical protein